LLPVVLSLKQGIKGDYHGDDSDGYWAPSSPR
jgi:hypothetical protein